MEIFLECLPCMLRQALEASRMATDDKELQALIMADAMKELSKYQTYACAPQLAEAIHNTVRKHTGRKDPYSQIKSRDIRMAQKVKSALRRYILESDDILANALKVSAIGNILDSALYLNVDLEACLSRELRRPFSICDKEELTKDLSTAKEILIIGDNAGEAVFDKLLIEYLSKRYKIVYAVRGAAIINDVTIQDALKINISDYAKIISTGCGMPGAYLDACNEEFKHLFGRADIIISKGQGNLEALSCQSEREVYYLLKAKCKPIANLFDVKQESYVFTKK